MSTISISVNNRLIPRMKIKKKRESHLRSMLNSAEKFSRDLSQRLTWVTLELDFNPCIPVQKAFISFLRDSACSLIFRVSPARGTEDTLRGMLRFRLSRGYLRNCFVLVCQGEIVRRGSSIMIVRFHKNTSLRKMYKRIVQSDITVSSDHNFVIISSGHVIMSILHFLESS